MDLKNFSSFIELIGALYFGFVGLSFLKAYYESHKRFISEREKVLALLNNTTDPKSIKEFLDKENGLYYEVIYQRLVNHNYYRFREIFIKGGVFCIYALLFIGFFNKENQLSNASLIFASSFFVFHSIYRATILLSKLNKQKFAHYLSHGLSEKMINLYLIDDCPWIKMIFSRRRLKRDFTTDLLLRMTIFTLVLFTIFFFIYLVLNSNNFLKDFVSSIELQDASVLTMLFTLVFPFSLMFIVDTYLRKKLESIFDTTEKKESAENVAGFQKILGN